MSRCCLTASLFPCPRSLSCPTSFHPLSLTFLTCPKPNTRATQGLITRPALVAEFLSGASLDTAIRRGAEFLGSDLVVTKVALDAARVGAGWLVGWFFGRLGGL